MITLWLAALAVIAAVRLAEALLRAWPLLLAGAAAAVGAYALGRRHGRRSAARLEAIAAQLAEAGRPGRPGVRALGGDR